MPIGLGSKQRLAWRIWPPILRAVQREAQRSGQPKACRKPVWRPDEGSLNPGMIANAGSAVCSPAPLRRH